MEAMMQDLRFALRQIRRVPLVSFIIVATLAVGIGSTAVIFSLVDTLLLRPVFHDESQLVKLSGAYVNRGTDWSVSLPNAADWKSLSRAFSDVGWYQKVSMTLTGGGQPERIDIAVTSPSLMRVLDVQPMKGRIYTDENAQPDGPRVTLISYGLWQQRFAADPAIIGKAIEINGRPATVIGIMPKNFSYPSANVDAYLALRATPLTWGRSNGGLSVVARMRHGVTVADAQRDLDGVSRLLSEEYPQANKDLSAFVTPFRQSLVGNDLAKALYLLAIGVGFVLLIACVNVAGLLLARATEREREIAVRAALGAGRGRVVRQLLTEGTVLAFAGGILALAIAAVAIRLLPLAIPTNTSLPRDFTVDPRVIGFSLLVTLATGVLFSALPALRATATDLNSLMGVRSSRGSRRHRERRGLLVVLEVALAVVLLASTGLAIRGLQKLLQTSPGFETTNLLTARVSLDGRYRDTTEARLFEDRVLRNLRALTGVEHASLVDYSPMSGTNNFNDVMIDAADPAKPANVGTIMVGTDYLKTMGIPLLAGRDFETIDVHQAPGVVMINRAFAEKFFPGQSPIGRRVLLSFESGKNPYWRTIVGVYGNVLHQGLDADKSPQRVELAVPISQLGWAMSDVGLVVRTKGDPAAATSDLRHAVSDADPSQPLFAVKTMSRLIDETDDVLLGNILAMVLASFGVIAMLLAALGLYGVISYSVTQRRFELGVRAALGADAASLLRMVMRQGAGLVLAGAIAGLAATYVSARAMRSLLHGVAPSDPAALGGTVAVLLLVALAATLVPALRASRTDPSLALREG